MSCLRLAALVLLLWSIPTAASAGPIYTLVHNADAFGGTGPIDTIGPQGAPIDYDFAYQPTYFTGANYGEVHANVNPGSMGITARTFNNGLYAPQRQEVSAEFAFDVIFSSPGTENINVVMNMDLSGFIGVPDFYQTAFVRAGAPNAASSGTYTRYTNSLNRNGMLSSFSADGTVQTIHTNPINVPVKRPGEDDHGTGHHPGLHCRRLDDRFRQHLQSHPYGQCLRHQWPRMPSPSRSILPTQISLTTATSAPRIPSPNRPASLCSSSAASVCWAMNAGEGGNSVKRCP